METNICSKEREYRIEKEKLSKKKKIGMFSEPNGMSF